VHTMFRRGVSPADAHRGTGDYGDLARVSSFLAVSHPIVGSARALQRD
jgi:hypothetical protein